MRDLHELPKLSDSLTYLYAEHVVVEQKAKAIELFDKDGATLVPTAALSVLLLGPGTRITHAAVKALADSGCAIVWVGEDGTRCYAHGGGETRKAYHLLHQARLVSDPDLRLEVCKRMYRMRFKKQNLDPFLTLEQLRGMEGARMRDAYAHASITYNVAWHGRSYDRASWGNSDPVNNALSAANALLNGLCHAAIVSGGYSPALGFIHTGLQTSFVYDIADLYKVEITIPTAFRIASESRERVQPRVREACRQVFKEAKLLQRILADIEALLAIPEDVLMAGAGADEDPGRPEPLWTAGDASTGAGAEGGGADRPPSLGAPVLGNDIPAHPHGAPSAIPDLEQADPAIQQRWQRATEGLQSGWTVAAVAEAEWRVATRPATPGYTVEYDAGQWRCTCPDFAKSGLGMCKHTAAVTIQEAGGRMQEAGGRMQEVGNGEDGRHLSL
jgi:CRISP-associated protein Cas1